jgi:ABC-type multidrug transport system ATPase subunit
LDILARRSKVGKVEGKILIGGKELSAGAYKRMTGYVFQDDVLMSTMTGFFIFKLS